MVCRAIAVALAAGILAAPVTFSAASAGEGFNPLRVARDAADLGLDTARRAVDLGLDTAEGAVDVAKDAVGADNCRKGERYRDRNGRWHTCD